MELEQKAVIYFGNIVCVESWANYIATNENGYIHCFHKEPEKGMGVAGGKWKSVTCRYQTTGCVGKSDGSEWANSLWAINDSEVLKTTDQIKHEMSPADQVWYCDLHFGLWFMEKFGNLTFWWFLKPWIRKAYFAGRGVEL